MATMRAVSCPKCKTTIQFDSSQSTTVTCLQCGQSFQYVRRNTGKQAPVDGQTPRGQTGKQAPVADPAAAPRGQTGKQAPVADGTVAPRGQTGRHAPVAAPAPAPVAATPPAAPVHEIEGLEEEVRGPDSAGPAATPGYRGGQHRYEPPPPRPPAPKPSLWSTIALALGITVLAAELIALIFAVAQYTGTTQKHDDRQVLIDMRGKVAKARSDLAVLTEKANIAAGEQSRLEYQLQSNQSRMQTLKAQSDFQRSSVGGKTPEELDREEKELNARKSALEAEIQQLKNDKPVSFEEIVKTSKQSVVVVVNGKTAFGTGFVVGPNLIMTNFHVIRRSPDITVRYMLPQAVNYGVMQDCMEVKVVAADPDRDIALLEVIFPRSAPSPLSTRTDADVGERVFAVGNPGAAGSMLSYTVSEGIVSAINRKLNGQTYNQTTAAVNPGNSGGPLFDSTGKVVGMVTLKLVGADNVGFVIPSEVLTDFLKNRDKFVITKPYNEFLAGLPLDPTEKVSAGTAENKFVKTATVGFMPRDWQMSKAGVVWLLDPNLSRLVGFRDSTMEAVKDVVMNERPLGFQITAGNLALVAVNSYGHSVYYGSNTTLLTVSLTTGDEIKRIKLPVTCFDFTPLDNSTILYNVQGYICQCNINTGEFSASPSFDWMTERWPKMRLSSNTVYLFQPDTQNKSLAIVAESLYTIRDSIRKRAQLEQLAIAIQSIPETITAGTGRMGGTYEETNPAFTKARNDILNLKRQIDQTKLFAKRSMIALPDTLPAEIAPNLEPFFGNNDEVYFGNLVLKGPAPYKLKETLPSGVANLPKDKQSVSKWSLAPLDYLYSMSPDHRYAASGLAIYDLAQRKIVCTLPILTPMSMFSNDSKSIFLFDLKNKNLLKFEWKNSLGDAAPDKKDPDAKDKPDDPKTVPVDPEKKDAGAQDGADAAPDDKAKLTK